jgi:hypothetical protein
MSVGYCRSVRICEGLLSLNGGRLIHRSLDRMMFDCGIIRNNWIRQIGIPGCCKTVVDVVRSGL